VSSRGAKRVGGNGEGDGEKKKPQEWIKKIMKTFVKVPDKPMQNKCEGDLERRNKVVVKL